MAENCTRFAEVARLAELVQKQKTVAKTAKIQLSQLDE